MAGMEVVLWTTSDSQKNMGHLQLAALVKIALIDKKSDIEAINRGFSRLKF